MTKLALGLLALLLSVPGLSVLAETSEPLWIHPSDVWEPGEVRYFRRCFSADSPATEGFIKVSADDEFELFVNGYRVGTGYFWPVAVTFDVAAGIREGRNAIAVSVLNNQSIGGLIVEGEFVLASSETVCITTDSSWKVSAQKEEGWTSPDFDDGTWASARAGYCDARFGTSLEEKEERMRLEHKSQPISLPWTDWEPVRFVGQTFRSHSPLWKDVDQLRRVCLLLKEMGFNLISVDIPWGEVETEPGVYDFSSMDLRLQELLRHGFYLQLKVSFLGGDGGWRLPPRIARDERLYKRSPSGERDETSTLTYASEDLNRQLAEFCRTVARHYRDYPVVNYSLLSSRSGEVEYHHAHYQDYSEPAQEQFRRWLKERYKTVESLNTMWGTKFGSFEGVMLPVPQDPVPDGEFDFAPQIVDFFKYREFSLQKYFDGLVAGFREGDPGAEVALTLGHVLSADCARRNSLSAYRWAQEADWLWIDPAPRDFYPIRIAVGRAAHLIGKKFAVEIDGLYAYKHEGVDVFETLPRQTLLSFQGGARIMTTANWQFAAYGPMTEPPEFERFAQAHRGMAAYVSPGTMREPATATDAVYVSKWTMFATHGNRRVWEKIEEYYKHLYGDGQRLVDIITDDIFADDTSVLQRYERIHIPYAPVVQMQAREALERSGIDLIAPEPWGMFDEYGRMTKE